MTFTETLPALVWTDLLERWDAQQSVYVPGRERGFEAMLSVLDALLPEEIVVLDLAAGPGSLSKRLLEHRENVSSVAVDLDPVLQTVGRGALGDMGGRLRWVTADLREPDWTDRLAQRRFDAVLSSTALHWLTPDALTELYESLAGLLRPGGIFLNFDGFPLSSPASGYAAAARAIDRARQDRALAAGSEAWQDWWEAMRAVPELGEAFAERDRVLAPARGRLFSGSDRPEGTTLESHESALNAAGFTEFAVIWQDFHRKIFLAAA
ncbi:class I SAM-dependent methyltransferase [Sciscionella sediminilitoris]|uniref:class I SAM-dependent methyltransferase n=1 Tax=Sciscionella sediminilitoris TaxID=1445613 RepID=UPI000565119F|nr:class I SAM-dependent methyltransferase [Sciscionella sp. SE31]